MYDRLKNICAEKGMTVTKLCEIVTGSTGNLATWKKDYMRSDYLSAAADVLGCSTDYLLGRVDNPNETYCPDDNAVPETSVVLAVNADKTSEEFMQIFANMNIADRVAVMKFAFDKIAET